MAVRGREGLLETWRACLRISSEGFLFTLHSLGMEPSVRDICQAETLGLGRPVESRFISNRARISNTLGAGNQQVVEDGFVTRGCV
jgi:hypothetical protein